MNALKSFFRNFRKHGSIYRVSDDRVKCASSTENYSEEDKRTSVQADTDDKTNKEEMSEVLGQENKDSIYIVEDLKNPHSQELTEDIVKNAAADDRTTECLKEFDEILEDFNKDITEACVSLNEIEDVINKLNEEDPQDSLFEIPRFDLQDLIPTIDSVDESIDDVESIVLDDVDLAIAEPIDLDEIDEPKVFTDETMNLNTENMEYCIEIDTFMDELEVISISSEDSHELKVANVENDEPNKVDSKHAGAYNEPKIVNIVNDEPINVDDDDLMVIPKSENGEPNNVKNVNAELNDEYLSENDESNVKSENSPSIDSDDCGYQSSDFEFITEDEAKMDGLIINVGPSTLKPKVNKPKRVKTIEISIDQFSGRQNNSNLKRIGTEPSNKHFIRPEQSNIRNNLNKRELNNEFIKTDPNMQANCFGQNNGRSTLRDVRRIRPQDLYYSNMDETVSVYGENDLEHTVMNCTQRNNQLEITYTRPNNLQNMQVDCSEIKTDNIQNHYPIYDSGLDNLGYGPSQSQGNSPDLTSHGPTNSLESLPSFNNFGLGPSFQENTFGNGPSHVENSPGFKQLQGPGNLQRNYPETPDPIHERWRAFRNRNPNQFVLDHSYRDNHRILDNEEYYRLFDPNFGPLPNQSMRQMENKSTMSMSMMLVEYEGVGFDMQMLREWSESEEDEVKEEADASAERILDMYPGENKKRRRF